MRLTKITFENVMELEGSIAFPEGKTIVIYGENKAGKSNIIHALRYAFLNKVIRGTGKTSGYDELKLVTAKEIVPAEGIGKILVEFEHNGSQFEILREIDRYRDSSKIVRKEAAGPRELDFAKTVDKELKAGLLNALFAPDSAMGFNHLNEKNIDAVIQELFKEIANAKVLTKDFKQRIERLKEEAQVRVANIERDYDSFMHHLSDTLGEAPVDLSRFETYDPGKTIEKMGYASDELKRYIDSIEKGELRKWLEDMRSRAKSAEDVESLLADSYQQVVNSFNRMEEISRDEEHLGQFLAELREVRPGSPVPQEPERFNDNELDARARTIYEKLKQAQALYSNALSLAEKENIDLKSDNPARIKSEKEKVLKLLTKEVSLDAPRVRADLVKIASEGGGESVHGLIPLQLMDIDPAFTRLSPEPIPDAPEEQKRQYAGALRQKIERLRVICEDKDKAENFFNGEFLPGLTKLSGYMVALMENARQVREKVSNLARVIHSKLLLFAQEDIEIPKLECRGDLELFSLTVKQVVSHKKSEYQLAIADRTKSLGIEAGAFSTQEIDNLLRKLAEMEKGIPSYKDIWTELTGQGRIEWERKDAEYLDLSYVPAVVDGLSKTLDAILANAFDEYEVIRGIKETITEINGKLTAEGLVNSCIEMGQDSLQLVKTTYKDREITHPCGAERSFFSLAALTALATYFKLPVIIDEAANNLDKNHLRHFISLIREFAASYDVQYILSIKDTDDFPLEGWVRDFADDLQIYKVDYDGYKKAIRAINLSD